MGKRKDIEDADALIDQLLALCASHRKTIAKLEKENSDLKALVKQEAYNIFFTPDGQIHEVKARRN